ncbi:MAG TPA: HIT domain-containing protein [Acidimicrobiales bacterium]
MSLEHLWAGWRGEYVASSGAAPPDAGRSEEGSPPGDDPAHCVFCRIAASGPPSAENGVVWAGATAYVVLNAYPYASGHVMVVPRRHVGALGGLTDEEGAELWSALRRSVDALESALHPEGFNLGANLGQAAGAGIPRHLHLHSVPRWLGDTNFMTAVAGARVLPETLAATWQRVHEAWPG